MKTKTIILFKTGTASVKVSVNCKHVTVNSKKCLAINLHHDYNQTLKDPLLYNKCSTLERHVPGDLARMNFDLLT